MSNSLTLFFRTNKNDTYLLKIPSVKQPLNPADVDAAMDAIIATGAIKSSVGTPVSKKKAVLSKQTKTELIPIE